MSSTVVDHDGANNDGDEGGTSAFASSILHKRKKKNNNSDIKGYGQRARQRLDQEKQKRREIQVLDHLPELPPPPPVVGVVRTPTSGNKKTARPRKKRRMSSNGTSSKRRSTTTTAAAGAGAGTVMVPIETPDVSQIGQPTHKQDQSPWVVLHGLPKGCTIDHIRRFFLGLIPQSIVMLLSNTARMESLLDATFMPNKNHSNIATAAAAAAAATAPSTQRSLLSSSIRVLVRFESSAVAILAAERSNETLAFFLDKRGTNFAGVTTGNDDDDDNHDDDDEDDDDDDNDDDYNNPVPAVFAIGVTHLDKSSAKALMNVGVKAKLAVTTTTTTGTAVAAAASRNNHHHHKTLEEQLGSVEAVLPPLVRETLWTKVYQECLGERKTIELDETTQQLAHWLVDLEIDDSYVEGNSKDGPSTLATYRSIARRHNRLIRLLEDLLEQILTWECKKGHTVSAKGGVQHLSQGTQEAALWLTKQACAFLDHQVGHWENVAQQVAFRTD